MVKLNWLNEANYDLIQIYNYIHKDSVYYSIKTVDLTENLKPMKYIGRKVPEYNEDNIRELIYKSYRIIYEVQTNKILIRGIWHSARILPKQLIS